MRQLLALTYSEPRSPPSLVRVRYFELQLRLVEEFQLPMFLHMRAAGEDFCRSI